MARVMISSICAVLVLGLQAATLTLVDLGKARQAVSWHTCALSERPKGNEVENESSARAELTDASQVMGNAMNIMNFARMEESKGKVEQAAVDVADAAKQIQQASIEKVAAEMVLKQDGTKQQNSVQGVDAGSLAQMMAKKEGSYIVVFYAPWCPNCQQFVMAGDAPVLDLKADMEAKHGPKVLKFDTEASTPPVSVNGVPDFYLFNAKTGTKARYTGSPNLQSLETWALEQSQQASLIQVGASTKPGAYTSWATLDDSMRSMQGKSTKASILSVKRAQLEASRETDQDRRDAVSPLSKLNIDSDDLSYEMKDGGNAYASWLDNKKGGSSSPAETGLVEQAAALQHPSRHSSADWSAYNWKFAGGMRGQ